MDPRELEEKLEKDNLTLKEHIQKLQNTIKHIKSEIIIKDEYEDKEHANKKYKNTKENKSTTNKNKISPAVKDKHKEQIPMLQEDYGDHDNDLKFSFNDKEKISKGNPHLNIEEEDLYLDRKLNDTKKKNIYQENIDKLRKEKDLINRMESIKFQTKKNFSNDVSTEELRKFQDYVVNRHTQSDSSDKEEKYKPYSKNIR